MWFVGVDRKNELNAKKVFFYKKNTTFALLLQKGSVGEWLKPPVC